MTAALPPPAPSNRKRGRLVLLAVLVLAGLGRVLQQPEEGIAALQRAADLPPRTFSVRLRLAEEYLKLGRIDEANALFRDLLAQQPDHPRALLGQGQILARRGQWQEALGP